MDSKYKKVDLPIGNTIEDAVKELLNHKEKGMLTCIDFNGTALYSDTVTMDEAYKEVTGKTKTEFDKAQQEWREDYKKQENAHKDHIPEEVKVWMSKGREILSEDKWEFWDKIVPVRLNDLYRGMELGCCLDIVKLLNNSGTLDEAKVKIESQDHSGMSFGLVCSMVKEFSERGNEFVEYIR